MSEKKRLKLLMVKTKLREVSNLLKDILDIEYEGDNILNTLSGIALYKYPFSLSLDEQITEIDEYIEWLEEEN